MLQLKHHKSDSNRVQQSEKYSFVKKQSYLPRLFVFLCLLILLIFTLGPYWPQTDKTRMISRIFLQHLPDSMCPDVVTGMSEGKWITRPLTKAEEKQIHTFLITARSHYGVSATMERSDKRCGNVGFPGLKSHPALKFRALCDPLGKTPCCENFKCKNKSVDDCSCPSCYDVRHQIHAEYATWTPTDSRCSLQNYTASRACNLLAGSKLYFIGDSYIRQMYVMMTMHLTDNYRDSVLLPNTPSARRKLYHGFFQLLCYSHLNRIKTVCNKTLLSHYEIITPNQGKYVQGLVNTLRHSNRSLILLGQGIHGAYDARSTWDHFLKPIAAIYNRTQQEWPKLLWVSPHSHGIMKIPRSPQQSDNILRTFNDFINKKLRESNVDVFDTSSMTKGVMSYDGAHYGPGVNMAKIQVVYNYLQDLANQGLW